MNDYEVTLKSGKAEKFAADNLVTTPDWLSYTDDDGATHRIARAEVVKISETPQKEAKMSSKDKKAEAEEGSDPAVAMSLQDRYKQADMATEGPEAVTGRTDGPNPEPVVKSRDEARAKGGAKEQGKTR